jgi:anti-sigma-K factor RskA
VDAITARPTPKEAMKARSRSAAVDRAASRTSHERSALIAKLSAWRSASLHLLNFSSIAVMCAGTGRQAPVD